MSQVVIIDKNITKQKHKNANKPTKIKNVLKKHLSGIKSLIHLFAYKSLNNRNIDPTKLLKVLSALHEQKQQWSH